MRICILIHGCDSFYSGSISRLIERLKDLGELKLFVTGTMARTASLDTDFPVEIWHGRPSDLLKQAENDFDVFLIASHSKSPESGYSFGEIVFRRSGLKKPFLQFELSNETAILWNCDSHPIADMLGFRTVHLESRELMWEEGGREFRKVSAVEAGELLLIEEIVVGRAKGHEVIIVAENGEVVDLIGVEVKRHGLEKLKRKNPRIELEKVKICTLKGFKALEGKIRYRRGFGIAFVDHSADEIYDFAGKCSAAVCVGDDTTAIAAEILFRFDTPVLGIVDGDRDSLLRPASIHPESEIVITKHDDLAGEIVFREIFRGKKLLPEDFMEVKRKIEEILQSKSLLVARKSLADYIS